jgi:hypothetical protein
MSAFVQIVSATVFVFAAGAAAYAFDAWVQRSLK